MGFKRIEDAEDMALLHAAGLLWYRYCEYEPKLWPHDVDVKKYLGDWGDHPTCATMFIRTEEEH